MFRFVAIVIVSWGLIVQPLMAAAMPAKMMTDSTHSSMGVDPDASIDTQGHHDGLSQSAADPSKAPCHEKSADEPSQEHCSKCDKNCANGTCAASCGVVSNAAALQELFLSLRLNDSTQVISRTGTRTDGPPSRIFHPPKHA